MNTPDRKKLLRIAALTVYFIVVFLLFVVIQFPYDRVKARLESEVRSRTSLELHVSRMSPRFLNRFALIDVVVSDRDGKVLFESPLVRTHVSLFALLRGMLAMDLKGAAYGGELAVAFEQGVARKLISVDATGLELGSYPLLRDLGLKLTGKVGGSMEMNNDAGKGRIWFRNLASRELKISGFPVPDLDFEQGWIEAETRGDRLTFRKCELDGKELKVHVSGDLVMRAQGSLNIIVKIKPSERLAQQQAGLLSLLKNRDPEGFYQLSLGGTLAQPLPRF